MTIYIESLSIDTIIGILNFERNSKQKVLIDVRIEYDYREENFIDYSKVAEKIEYMLEDRKYGLLEEAIADIGGSLISDYPQIEKLYIKISKPDIIKNASVAVSKEWR
jgi:dihydroneopterin aldolase